MSEIKGTVLRMSADAHSAVKAARDRLRDRLITPDAIVHPAYAKRLVDDYRLELFDIIARETT